MIKYRAEILCRVLLSLLIFCAGVASAVEVSAQVSSNRIITGEALGLQVVIDSDSENIVPPDLSALSDFSHTFRGATRSARSYNTMVNGQYKHEIVRSIILNYELIALKDGRLDIPALIVDVDGKEYSTEPITVIVSKSQEAEAISILEYKIPQRDVYLGETVPLELVWYFRNNPELNGIDIPAFSDSRFLVSKMPVPKTVERGKRLIELSFNGGKYWAVQGETLIDGVAYATLSMKWYLSAKETGSVELDPSTIVASFLMGYRENSRHRGIPEGFSSFFDNDPFFSGREPVLKKIATKTQPASLNVLPLPVNGRPDNYTGVVSRIKVGAEASTDKAAVGEPVEVDLFVSGSDNIYNMKLPDFNDQSDIKGKFKVTCDSNSNDVVGNMRKYRLTFRALTPDITAIPPLKVAYFDPDNMEYEEAQTWELPLTVTAAKIVTASDIEGNTDGIGSNKAPEVNTSGIHENVTSVSALVNQNISVMEYIEDNKVFFAVFPGCYFSLLLGQLVVNRRRVRSGERVAGRAVGRFKSSLKNLEKNGVNADNLSLAIIDYYKSRSQVTGKEYTLSDIHNELSAMPCIDDVTLVNFKKIIDYCEACCYTGGAQQQLSGEFVRSVSAVISKIDSELG